MVYMKSALQLGKGLSGLFLVYDSLNGHFQQFCLGIPFVARDEAMGGNLETVQSAC